MDDRTDTALDRGTDTPHGPEEVRAALIEAGDRLCARSVPSQVTVRAVAAEARVTTGLVHHYFESKDALLIATVRASSRRISAAAQAALGDTGDPGAAVEAVWRYLEERPAFRNIIVWWMSRGRDVTELMGEHPFLKALADLLAARDPVSAPIQAGTAATLIMAGMLAPGANRAVDLEPDDRSIADELERLSIEIVRGAPTAVKDH